MFSQVKMIAIAVFIASIVALSYVGFSYIKSLGYQEATLECKQKIDEYKTQVQLRINNIEQSVNSISVSLSVSNEVLSNDISALLRQVKNTQNIIVKNGKCVPTDEYLKRLNAAIERANK
jgi:predicted PurR-regulated permease PerM